MVTLLGKVITDEYFKKPLDAEGRLWPKRNKAQLGVDLGQPINLSVCGFFLADGLAQSNPQFLEIFGE